MTATAKVIAPTLMPLLRYRDVAGAIEWLGEAFGFERGSSVTADRGTILYAQLTLGNAMIMVEPVTAGVAASAAEPSGTESQSCYIVVADADAHYARARAAGAEIVLDIGDFGQGGRGYSCRDGERHVWSFGTYDPWHGEARIPSVHEPPELRPAPPASTARASARWAILSGLLATIVTSAVAAAWIGGSDPQVAPGAETSLSAAPIAADEFARERAAREAAERAAQEAEARALEAAEKINAQAKSANEAARAAQQATSILAAEQVAHAAAEKAAKQARDELSRERSAKEAAERAAAELKTQLARQTAEAHAAAEQPPASTSKENLAERPAREDEAAELKEKLAQEQTAREVAERASREAREQISRERALKDQAWKSVAQLRKQLARAQASANGADYMVPADPPVASSGPANTKEGDPQYNGPLAPF